MISVPVHAKDEIGPIFLEPLLDESVELLHPEESRPGEGFCRKDRDLRMSKGVSRGQDRNAGPLIEKGLRDAGGIFFEAAVVVGAGFEENNVFHG